MDNKNLTDNAAAEIIMIPDPNFLAALPDSLKTAEGNVLKAKAARITMLDIGEWEISDLSGIEYFTALEGLTCSINRLTKLDISKNTALTHLNCDRNKLSTLDVSKNTALISLNCSGNNLTELDITNNTALNFLGCSKNQLTALDITKNTGLTILWCSDNQLTALDTSQNAVLANIRSDFTVS